MKNTRNSFQKRLVACVSLRPERWRKRCRGVGRRWWVVCAGCEEAVREAADARDAREAAARVSAVKGEGLATVSGDGSVVSGDGSAVACGEGWSAVRDGIRVIMRGEWRRARHQRGRRPLP
ncbi:hypothetical protein BIFGAL_03915 [Bifidobacterium gallicum DSM 20093 = LMG 11596]|uniref:Uncharacterized protein n=1 Tax=Bifidobacterium gallicum DSM 20093 = LMG 11596 TaxID=561180 RepID=D1NVM4_9BIFI|nr:hypothetical protein BIFGAL_03915 [Bifidobacterium gallicum DSM 20093 = LMG 11596]